MSSYLESAQDAAGRRPTGVHEAVSTRDSLPPQSPFEPEGKASNSMNYSKPGMGSWGAEQKALQQQTSSLHYQRLQSQAGDDWSLRHPAQDASRRSNLGLTGGLRIEDNRNSDHSDEASTSGKHTVRPVNQLPSGNGPTSGAGSQGRQEAPRAGVGSPLGGGTAAAAGLDRNGPWDLRRGAANNQATVKQFQQNTGSRSMRGTDSLHASQGLTPLLNAPGSTAPHMGTLGAIWCWPFGAGPDLSLIVPPADPNLLPPVGMADFEPYLRSTGNSQIRFEEARQRAAEEAARPSPVAAAVGELGDSSVSSRVAPGEGLVEALRGVPPMFFTEDFSLARPGTWREVLGAEDEHVGEQRAARLEEYSGYLDIVETQLLKEIAARSENFFEAGAVVQDLRTALHRTYSAVTSLWQQVATLRGEMGEAAQTVTRLKRRHANMEAVRDKLKVVEEVAAAQEAVELLLPQGDFAGALDVLDSLRGTLMTHHTAGLHAFRHLPAQLADIAEAVDDLLSSETLRIAQFHEQASVVARIASSLSAEGSGRDHLDTQRSLSANVCAGRMDLQEELTPLILGLRRTGHLSATIKLMRAAAAEELKAGVRDVVDQSLQQLLGDRLAGSPLADRLLALQPAQCLQLLGCVTEVTTASLAHLREVQSAIEGLLKGSKAGREMAAAVAHDFAEVVQAVSEAAHSRWIRLLASRSTAVSSLELGELRQLIEASDHFASTVQGFGARPVLALRNAVQVQSKAFLETMHHRALAELIRALEQEIWVTVEVASPCQAIVDGIFKRATDAGLGSAVPTKSRQPEGNGISSSGVSDKLQVGEHAFHAVESLLLLLELLDQYLAFLDTLSGLAAETAHRVVELVKVFNSRTCQLVLGAGAMQVAGLKSITAKHLALSCQCLGALISLHVPLLAALGAPLPVSRRALLVPELRLVLQDLTVHRGEVHSKLVGIMRERLIVSLKQLPTMASRWAALPPGTETQPSAFSLNMAKQLRILAQVLSPLLLEEELHAVFGRIGVLFSKSLADAFSRLEAQGPVWETQVRANLQFLLTALRELPMAPGSQESNLERLSQLCRTRFAPLADATPRSSPSHPAASERQSPKGSSQYSPAPPERQTLVSRLGTAKLPSLFRRDPSGAEAGRRTADDDMASRSAAVNGGVHADEQRQSILRSPTDVDVDDDNLRDGAEALGRPTPNSDIQSPAAMKPALLPDDDPVVPGRGDRIRPQSGGADPLLAEDGAAAAQEVQELAAEEDELSIDATAAENAIGALPSMSLQGTEEQAGTTEAARTGQPHSEEGVAGLVDAEPAGELSGLSFSRPDSTAGDLADALLSDIAVGGLSEVAAGPAGVQVAQVAQGDDVLTQSFSKADDLGNVRTCMESETASLGNEPLPLASPSSEPLQASGMQSHHERSVAHVAAEAIPEPGSGKPVVTILPPDKSEPVMSHLDELAAADAAICSLENPKETKQQELDDQSTASLTPPQEPSQNRALAISEMLRNMEAEALEWEKPAGGIKE